MAKKTENINSNISLNVVLSGEELITLVKAKILTPREAKKLMGITDGGAN